MAKYMKNPKFKGVVRLPGHATPLKRDVVVEGDFADLVAEGKLIEAVEGAEAPKVVPADAHKRAPANPLKTHAAKVAAGTVKGPMSAEKRAELDAKLEAKRAGSASFAKAQARRAAVAAKGEANRAASSAKKAAVAAAKAAKAARVPVAPVVVPAVVSE